MIFVVLYRSLDFANQLHRYDSSMQMGRGRRTARSLHKQVGTRDGSPIRLHISVSVGIGCFGPVAGRNFPQRTSNDHNSLQRNGKTSDERLAPGNCGGGSVRERSTDPGDSHRAEDDGGINS